MENNDGTPVPQNFELDITKKDVENEFLGKAITDDFQTIEIAAKLLNQGIGRNKLLKLLRDTKVLEKKNIPYQRFIDKGYFKLQARLLSNGAIVTIPVVSLRGLVFIKRLLKKNKKD